MVFTLSQSYNNVEFKTEQYLYYALIISNCAHIYNEIAW